MILNKDIHIKSIQDGMHLGVSTSGVVYAHPNRCGWEKFSVIGESENDVMLRSTTGFFLCITGTRIYASKSTGDARWKVVKSGRGYKLQGLPGNKFLEVLHIRDTNGAVKLIGSDGGTVFELTEPGQLSMFTTDSNTTYCGMHKYPMSDGKTLYASQAVDMKWLDSATKGQAGAKTGKVIHHSGAKTTALNKGRCGNLFGNAKCTGTYSGAANPEYCNEANGWCGTTSGHKNAQASTAFDYVPPKLSKIIVTTAVTWNQAQALARKSGGRLPTDQEFKTSGLNAGSRDLWMPASHSSGRVNEWVQIGKHAVPRYSYHIPTYGPPRWGLNNQAHAFRPRLNDAFNYIYIYHSDDWVCLKDSMGAINVPIMNIKKACPPGYTGPNDDNMCITGWTSACGEGCAKSKCSAAKGSWIPLNYGYNPYTCQMGEDPACLSSNGRDCLWNKGHCKDGQRTTAVLPSTSSIKPLVCGTHHQKQWGSTGYVNPQHWCKRSKDMMSTAYGALWLSNTTDSQYNMKFVQKGGGAAAMSNGSILEYSKKIAKTTRPDLGYNISAWSGGWRSGSCPNGGRYGFFGVVANGKMLIGVKIKRPNDNDPQGGKGDNCSDCKGPGRGLNIVVVSSKGALLHHASYDTYANTYMSKRFIDDLQVQKAKKDDDRVIIIGVYDEASNKLTSAARNAISALGAIRSNELRSRGSYLVVFHPRSQSLVFEGLNNCGNVKYEYDCGVHCKALYNMDYYKGKYSDIATKKPKEIDSHWEKVGLKAGRRASKEFDAKTYGNIYDDLSSMDNVSLANHYMTTGLAQGRMGALDISNKFHGLISNYLVCYLDARDRDSLVHGAKQWRDLSGKANHFNFKKPIVCDGLRADMSSCGQGVGPDVQQLDINARTNGGSYTIVMVMREKLHTTAYPTGFYIGQRNNTQRGISCAFWPDKRVYFDNMGCCTMDTQRAYYTMGAASQLTHVYTFTRTPDGGLDIYVNGIRKAKGIRGKAYMPDLLGKAYLGHTGTWHADMQVLLVYNAGLPESAIKKINEWYQKTNSLFMNELLDDSEAEAKKLLPEIPVRGLALAMDAGNKNCYMEGSLDVKDLSGRKLDLKFTKAPKVKNGAWISDGSDMTLSGPSATQLGIAENDDYTIIARCKTTRLNSSILFNLPGYYASNVRSSGARGILLTPTYRDGNLYWDQDGHKGSTHRILYNTKHMAPKMSTYCLVRNSLGRHLYINGTLIKSTSDRGAPITTINKPLEIFKISNKVPMPGAGDTFHGELSHLMFYRVALTTAEIKRVGRYVRNPYIIRDSSWDQALEQCSKTSAIMCDMDNICHAGKAVDPSKNAGALAPMGAQKDTWVNLDTCQNVKNSGTVKSAHIKCCPIKRVNKYFTAACNYKGTVYFFKGRYVMEYLITGAIHQAKKARTISNMFPGIPDAFQADIDAAGIMNNGHMYLFKDMLGMVYDTIEKRVITQPTAISSILESKQIVNTLPSDFKGYYDTVLTLGSRMILFKGSQVFVYGHRYNLSQFIPGNVMDTGVDSWMHLSDGNRVATREGYLYHFNTMKMMPMLEYFYDLRPPFVSSKERCINLEKTIQRIKPLLDQARGTNPGLYKYYSKRLSSINQEDKNYCKYKSMYDYKNAMETRKNQIVKIKKSIVNYQGKQTESVENAKIAASKLAKKTLKISDLEKEIALEKAKKCPVDASCQSNALAVKQNTKHKTCSTSMIKQILRKHGYNDSQITQLSAVLDKKATIDDFDIRTHSNFHGYTHRNNVKMCPADMSTLRKPGVGVDVDVGATDYNSLLNSLKNSPNGKGATCSIRAIEQAKLAGAGKEMEQQAYQILKDSLLKYHVKYVKENIPEGTEGKQESENAQTMSEMSKATKKMVCDLKVDDDVSRHLQLLKDIQGILSQTHNHPNYRKIAGDIKKLEKQLHAESKSLQQVRKGSIAGDITELQLKVTNTKNKLESNIRKLKGLHKKN
jgi:hypothetical protein